MHSISIVKRQADENSNDAELCKGRPPSEYFRLTADEDCRDVVRCSVQGLLALRCPSGLAFDIDKQTCDWKSNVKNCQQLESKFVFRFLVNVYLIFNLIKQNLDWWHLCSLRTNQFAKLTNWPVAVATASRRNSFAMESLTALMAPMRMLAVS